MAKLRPYQQLASLYHQDWGDFALLYLKLFDRLEEKYHFKPESVLDLACGTGELVQWLTGHGVNAAGVDICPEMLEQARMICPEGEFIQADMREFDLGRQFEVITCTFDSVNYLLSTRSVEKMFTQVFKHLAPGGYFMFDINTPLLYRKKHFGEIVREAGGVEFRQILPDYDPDNRIALTLFDFGENRVEEHRQKGYTADDMKPLLERCGFELTETMRNTNGEPVTEEAFRIFFIAQKPQEGA